MMTLTFEFVMFKHFKSQSTWRDAGLGVRGT